MKITKVKCPTSKYNLKCPYEMNPEFIVVHNTYNDASAMAEISYMLGNNNSTSFHVAVDNERIVQGIDFNRNTWHSGDGRNGKGNRKGISIEICYSKSGGERFNQAEKLTAEYIAYLLKEYGWGIEKVTKHQDYSKKYCPHRTLDLGWERFINMIKDHLADVGNPINYTVKINTNTLNVRENAGTQYPVTTKVHDGEVYTIVKEKDGWGKLKSGAGWISLDYTKRTDNTPSNTTKYVLGKYVVNTKSGLNVRKGAGTNYKVVKKYTNGTRFDTYEINGEWARTPSGWVNLKYCRLVNKY